MGLACIPMHAEAYLETTVYGISVVGLLCKSHYEALLQMFNWVVNKPGIGFTGETVYRMSMFVWYSKKLSSKICQCLLFSWFNKNLVGLTKKA